MPDRLFDVPEQHEPARGESAGRPEDSPDFMTFWAIYGRLGPRKVAWECWKRARRRAPAEAIIAGLERWVAYWSTPGAVAVKWPQGWLNDDRWADDPPTFLIRLQRPVSRTASVTAHVEARRRSLNGHAVAIPERPT